MRDLPDRISNPAVLNSRKMQFETLTALTTTPPPVRARVGDGWVDSGDLGFLHDAQLVITERAAEVIFVPQIPKTTSGKLQRRQLAVAAGQGEFDQQFKPLMARLEGSVTATDPADDTVEQLLKLCGDLIEDRQIGPDDNLFEVELSSLDLAQLFDEIEQQFPVKLEITDLFDYPTITSLARYLDERQLDG